MFGMLVAPIVTDPEKYKDCLGLWDRLMAMDLEKGCFSTSTFSDSIEGNSTWSDDTRRHSWFEFFALVYGFR